MLHSTASFKGIVLLIAFLAVQAFKINTAFHITGTSLEFIVGKTVSALTSLIPHTPKFHSLADSIDCKIVSALTGSTSILVVGLAVADIAISIVKSKGFDAFFADVVDLILASQD